MIHQARERQKNARNCISIVLGKSSGSIFRGVGKKHGTNESEGDGGERVHHGSLSADSNQLLTPCRLAAEPTNDAMMAVSFPRAAAYPRSDAEWENDRVKKTEGKRTDEGSNWERKLDKTFRSVCLFLWDSEVPIYAHAMILIW